MSTLLSSPSIQRGQPPAPRVLIVEDDPNSRRVLSTLMRRLGYDCRTASHGEEALDIVASFEPQVILMDLMMPVLDGLETTRRLKADARTREIPVLALSGNVTPHGMSAAERAGCDDFLTKPIVLRELLARLRRYFSAGSPFEDLPTDPAPREDDRASA